MSELKKCPFCGGSDIIYEEALSVTYCNDCGGELDEGFGSDWNTRPIEDALQSRIAELEHDLTNKEIEYTDLWDDALAFQSRIAELESVINQLIEAGNTIVFETFEGYKKHGLFDFAPVNTWQVLVKDWLVKERER